MWKLPVNSNGHIVLGTKLELGGNWVKLHKAHGYFWIVLWHSYIFYYAKLFKDILYVKPTWLYKVRTTWVGKANNACNLFLEDWARRTPYSSPVFAAKWDPVSGKGRERKRNLPWNYYSLTHFLPMSCGYLSSQCVLNGQADINWCMEQNAALIYNCFHGNIFFISLYVWVYMWYMCVAGSGGGG